MAARRTLLNLAGLICLLAAACSQSEAEMANDVLGLAGICIPTSDELGTALLTPGTIDVQEGSTLSNVAIGIDTTTGFDGDVQFALVNQDDFSGAFGIEYEESQGFTSLPSTVQGPGTFWIAVILENSDRAEMLLFSEVTFDIDGVSFITQDEFPLEIKPGGCRGSDSFQSSQG